MSSDISWNAKSRIEMLNLGDDEIIEFNVMGKDMVIMNQSKLRQIRRE